MTAYLCDECQWCGTEPELRREVEKLDDGPAFAVVVKSCPDCGGEDLRPVTLCVSCQEQGIDSPATHDDYCAECAKANLEPADMEIFRRDQVQAVQPLVKP